MMQHTTPDYRVHLNACLQSDVLAICNVLRTILANEQGSHSVSRPPIFSSGSMQMAQKLLQNVHDNHTSREIVHVLPGSHNMYSNCFLKMNTMLVARPTVSTSATETNVLLHAAITVLIRRKAQASIVAVTTASTPKR